MGVRFSRRIRILPGLSLNFSGSGVSMSAGVRGARVTLGPRGAYTSVGIPGTGLSYRQRVGGVRRSAGPVQLQEKDLNLTGDRANDDLVRTLFHEGTQNVPLSPEQARRCLTDPRLQFMDPETGRRVTAAQLEAKIKAAELQEKIEKLQLQLRTDVEDYQRFLNFWLPLPSITSLADWENARNARPLEPQTMPPATPDWTVRQAQLIEELTEHHASSGWGKLLPRFMAKTKAGKEILMAWPEREAQLKQDDARCWQEYQQKLAEEAARWNEAEARRVAWVECLLAGELDEAQNTVAEVVKGLTFPFDTRCEFFLNDAQTVQVAAYTQRPRVREGDPIDTYVLDVAFARPAVVEFTQKEQNLTAFLARLGARLAVNKDGSLGRIESPTWLTQADIEGTTT